MISACIRVVDTEDFGEPSAGGEVLEIGFTDIYAHTTDFAGEPYDWRVAEQWHSVLAKPSRPIPAESSAIHHLIEEDFSDAGSFEEAVRYAVDYTEEGAPAPIAYAAHSAEHEISFLKDTDFGKLPWICTRQTAMHAYPFAPGAHSNQALRYWLKPIGLERDRAAPAHRGGPDSYVSAHTLCEMLNEGHSIEKLLRWTNEPALLVACPFKRYRGQPWEAIDDGMLNWILRQDDMDKNVLHTARHHLKLRAESAHY